MTESGVFQAFNAAVAAIRGEMQAGFSSIHERIDQIHSDRVTDATWRGKTEQDVKSAHRRIEETNEAVAEVKAEVKGATGPGGKGWAAIILAIGAAIAGIVGAFTGRESKSADSAAHAKEGK